MVTWHCLVYSAYCIPEGIRYLVTIYSKSISRLVLWPQNLYWYFSRIEESALTLHIVVLDVDELKERFDLKNTHDALPCHHTGQKRHYNSSMYTRHQSRYMAGRVYVSSVFHSGAGEYRCCCCYVCFDEGCACYSTVDTAVPIDSRGNSVSAVGDLFWRLLYVRRRLDDNDVLTLAHFSEFLPVLTKGCTW